MMINLTHLLRQQINILFVAALWGIVQLYQSQRLLTHKQHFLLFILVRYVSERETFSVSPDRTRHIVLPEWWQ